MTASLARIPDLERSRTNDDSPAASGGAADPASAPSLAPATADDDGPPTGPVVATEVPSAAPRRSRRVPSAAPRPPWWRRVGFAAILIVLVAAIPVLGREGYRIITSSTDGRLVDDASGRNDPNYEELVESTPTAVLMQTDAEGVPVALTVLALTADKGGTIIFVPLDTKLAKEGFGVDRLRSAFSMRQGAPAKARAAMVSELGRILNVGIDETIELDNRGFAQAVAPVAPLTFDNLAPIDLSGFIFESGPIELGPDLAGPYLAHLYDGEDQLGQFARQEVVWRAWLSAVAASADPGAVPGDPTSGIGLFVPMLAAGPVNFATLPGTYLENGRFEPDRAAIDELVLDAVPVPDAAYPGSRAVVRVLNGVEPGPPPLEVTRAVARYRGTLAVVGNAPSFDRTQTDVIYREAEMQETAELMLESLGALGEARLDPQATDTVDITILLGSDVLDDLAAIKDDPAPTTEATTTVPSGGT
ncbi:MAG: hypothetical protein ABI239_14455 [Aquihabitans sp.]